MILCNITVECQCRGLVCCDVPSSELLTGVKQQSVLCAGLTLSESKPIESHRPARCHWTAGAGAGFQPNRKRILTKYPALLIDFT